MAILASNSLSSTATFPALSVALALITVALDDPPPQLLTAVAAPAAGLTVLFLRSSSDFSCPHPALMSIPGGSIQLVGKVGKSENDRSRHSSRINNIIPFHQRQQGTEQPRYTCSTSVSIKLPLRVRGVAVMPYSARIEMNFITPSCSANITMKVNTVEGFCFINILRDQNQSTEISS